MGLLWVCGRLMRGGDENGVETNSVGLAENSSGDMLVTSTMRIDDVIRDRPYARISSDCICGCISLSRCFV